uniref:Uncharacterized protein n=1 Tax=Arundo donax TaxID=35708 RepID=A0A0A9EQT5_ARUDO
MIVFGVALSGPPSWATASTKRSWSSAVHRRRGLGSVVRTRPPESPCTHIGRSSELSAEEPCFLGEGNILFSQLLSEFPLSLSL